MIVRVNSSLLSSTKFSRDRGEFVRKKKKKSKKSHRVCVFFIFHIFFFFFFFWLLHLTTARDPRSVLAARFSNRSSINLKMFWYEQMANALTFPISTIRPRHFTGPIGRGKLHAKRKRSFQVEEPPDCSFFFLSPFFHFVFSRIFSFLFFLRSFLPFSLSLCLMKFQRQSYVTR